MNAPAYGVTVSRAHAPTNSGARFSTNAVQPLVGVLGAEQLLHQLGLERQPVVERQLAALVHAALDRGDRQRRARRPARSAYSRDSSRRRRRRTPARPGPIWLRLLDADSVRPVISSSSARDGPISRVSRWVPPLPGSSPSVTSGSAEPVAARRWQPDVAGQRDLEPAAQRVPGDVGDEQLLRRGHPPERVLADPDHVHVGLDVALE